MVVVAGDDDDLAVADGSPDPLEDRLGELDDPPERPIAELEDVAEQNDPIGAREEALQSLAEGRPSQQIRVAGGAEVEVGDDDRSHRRILASVAARAQGVRSWVGAPTRGEKVDPRE